MTISLPYYVVDPLCGQVFTSNIAVSKNILEFKASSVTYSMRLSGDFCHHSFVHSNHHPSLIGDIFQCVGNSTGTPIVITQEVEFFFFQIPNYLNYDT